MDKLRREGTKIESKATEDDFEQKAKEVLTDDEFADEDFMIEEAAKDDIKIWYYIDKGEINGAFTKNEMLIMYHNGTLKETTEVWNNTMSDWIELEQTALYERKGPVKRKAAVQKGKEKKINKSLIWVWCILCAIVIILCVGSYVINIKSKAESDKVTVLDDSTNAQDTGDEKGITVKKIVEKYITDPKYDLQTQENKESILTVTGTLTYEGKTQEAVLQFRIESDGSVHFQQMSINGETNDTVYQELLEGMQVE